MSHSAPASPRRADLDWIRVAALGLLIVYHVMLVYAPWDWHVHSPHHYDWLGYAALVSNPWRLTLLFLVSGAAVRLMSRRRSVTEVVSQRAARLLPPFLFGVLVLVPPQSWIEAMDKGSFQGGLSQWWLKEFSLAGLANGVPVNHLWFVLYIIAYSLVAIGLLARPRLLERLEAGLEKALRGWGLLLVPILFLALARQILFPFFGITNHLPHDWYNHAVSLGAFLAGFLLAPRAEVWRALEERRWTALGLAGAALAALVALEMHPGGRAFGGTVKSAVFAIDQWATIAAVLGFASRHLRAAEGPVLRYLNQAIFPCYLAHQTLLVVAAALLLPRGLPAAAEAALLVLITLGGSLAAYEAVRRVGPLRPLWGLKRLAPPASGRPARLSGAQPAEAG